MVTVGSGVLGCTSGTFNNTKTLLGGANIVRQFQCIMPSTNGSFTIQFAVTGQPGFKGNWRVAAGARAYANFLGSGSFSTVKTISGHIDFHP